MQGGDKGLVMLHGKPLYQHVLAILQPQVTQVLISANRHTERYQQSGCDVFADTFSGFAGPLAGMLTALKRINTEWAIFASCDTPFLPANLVSQLWQGKEDRAKVAWVQSGERDHPTLALVHRSLAPQLEAYLQRGDRKLMFFLQEMGGKAVNFEDERAFININTPEDLALFQDKG
ncbi:molybdenum cofactor guanylyltransferase MobA [Erwinia sp.]|uniref:molybdenum cofactor guanylyltransferase MobA n=1 Tax=Erwinia citreus TaxID=558 RepID=UPI003C78386B